MQFPDSFEFDVGFLCDLADHVYSGWFGTFMLNCERARRTQALSLRSLSVWSLLNAQRSKYLNARCAPPLMSRSIGHACIANARPRVRPPPSHVSHACFLSVVCVSIAWVARYRKPSDDVLRPVVDPTTGRKRRVWAQGLVLMPCASLRHLHLWSKCVVLCTAPCRG